MPSNSESTFGLLLRAQGKFSGGGQQGGHHHLPTGTSRRPTHFLCATVVQARPSHMSNLPCPPQTKQRSPCPCLQHTLHAQSGSMLQCAQYSVMWWLGQKGLLPTQEAPWGKGCRKPCSFTFPFFQDGKPCQSTVSQPLPTDVTVAHHNLRAHGT